MKRQAGGWVSARRLHIFIHFVIYSAIVGGRQTQAHAHP